MFLVKNNNISSNGLKPGDIPFSLFQGSSAFVIGWMNFADLFFNGAAVRIIQALTPPRDKYYSV